VQPFPVVELEGVFDMTDQPGDGFLQFRLGHVGFSLQRAEERLHMGVVVADVALRGDGLGLHPGLPCQFHGWDLELSIVTAVFHVTPH